MVAVVFCIIILAQIISKSFNKNKTGSANFNFSASDKASNFANQMDSNSIESVANRVSQSVVSIVSKNQKSSRFFYSTEDSASAGTGIIISENGYGKRTALEEYATTKARGGKGVITFKVSEKTGKVAAGLVVLEGEEVMVISKEGTLIRLSTSDISIFSRNTQGVKVMRLGDGDNVIAAARIAGEDN